MTLSDFLSQLSADGLAVVSAESELTSGEGWREVIEGWHAVQRDELPFEAPALSPAAAEWAALRLYRGCQALVCRDMPPQDLTRYLAVPCPEPRGPSVDYSVDLVFRFLPGLVAMARRVEQGDPLVAVLLTLAQRWPLSSVGIDGVGAVEPEPFLGHPGLCQLYADRILATGDTSRLNHPAVREALQVSLGAFPELAPPIAAALTATA
jgi:hypothetical protein